MDFERSIELETEQLAGKGLLRTAKIVTPFDNTGPHILLTGRPVLNFASNDYLNLNCDPRVRAAAAKAIERFGVGSGSARLLSGTTEVHAGLESALSEFLHCKSVVLYSSGYLANLGAMSAALGRHDLVLSDKLVHASLIDGITLSGAEHRRFRHNDTEHLRDLLKRVRADRAKARIWVVTESIFSMNGDTAPVTELFQVADEYGAELIVDEAHALGVFGNGGRGACVRPPALRTGTLSKAFGSYGGFIGGGEFLLPWLHSTSRPFIFNTSLPPALCAAAIESLRIICTEPDLGHELLSRAERFRALLTRAGFNCLGSCSQIVPILIGEREKTRRMSELLLERGLFAPHIRPPTVPPGAERIRFSLTLGMDDEMLENAADEIIAAGKRLEVC